MNMLGEMSTAFVLSGQRKNTVCRQSSPGIFVFSRSLQMQYVNRRALELIRTIGQAMTESDSIVLPPRLLELRAQVQECLDDRLEAHIWEPFEMSRAVFECGRRLLLRGFGYPNGVASRESRVIIVLEEIRPAEKDESQLMRARVTAPEMQTVGAGCPV